MNKLFKLIFDRHFRFSILSARGFNSRMSDEKFLKKKFKMCFGYELDLENPKTFNEKLQWLKIHDRKPEYTRMVDKYEVKKYVSSNIGDEHIIPTLGIWDKFEDIDFNALPDQFVLKCTHDSGGLVICKDKAKLNKDRAKRKIEKSLKCNYYFLAREWPYKNVKPRIIAEQYMTDGHSTYLPVFKFFCFDGKPYLIQSIQNDKQPNESIDYFDTDWNLLELKQNHPNSDIPLPKPDNFDEMLKIAEKLSEGHSFIRVDLYNINSKIYFSEFTFYTDSGLAKFVPSKWDVTLGDMIKLPEVEEAKFV